MTHPEINAIAQAGRPAARATARLLALQARSILHAADRLLTAAGDDEAAKVAAQAGEATTQLITATYDGPNRVFACKR